RGVQFHRLRGWEGGKQDADLLGECAWVLEVRIPEKEPVLRKTGEINGWNGNGNDDCARNVKRLPSLDERNE
ncbi:hypothetical protein AVEN_216012-1, partial [Araneus ventricosus]